MTDDQSLVLRRVATRANELFQQLNTHPLLAQSPMVRRLGDALSDLSTHVRGMEGGVFAFKTKTKTKRKGK